MFKVEKNITILRSWLPIVMMFVILLSSCATKRGFKSLFNFPTNTTKTVNNTSSGSFINAQKTCLSCSDLEITIADRSISLDKVPTVALLTNIFNVFLVTIDYENIVETTYLTPNFFGEIPKYLLFKKLILHHL